MLTLAMGVMGIMSQDTAIYQCSPRSLKPKSLAQKVGRQKLMDKRHKPRIGRTTRMVSNRSMSLIRATYVNHPVG